MKRKIVLTLLALIVVGWGAHFTWEKVKRARYVKAMDRAATIRVGNEPQQREMIFAYLQEFEDAMRSGDPGRIKKYYSGWDKFKDSSDRNLRAISGTLENYSWKFSNIQFEDCRNSSGPNTFYYWFCNADVAVTYHYGWKKTDTSYSSFRMKCYPDQMKIWDFPFLGK